MTMNLKKTPHKEKKKTIVTISHYKKPLIILLNTSVLLLSQSLIADSRLYTPEYRTYLLDQSEYLYRGFPSLNTPKIDNKRGYQRTYKPCPSTTMTSSDSCPANYDPVKAVFKESPHYFTQQQKHYNNACEACSNGALGYLNLL